MNRSITLLIITAVASLALASGCRTNYKAETRRGSVNAPTNATVVLFPAPCHSSDNKCKDSYGDAVTAMVSTELEFAGFRVLHAEKLVREARSREDQSAGLSVHRRELLAAKSRRQVGSIFEDLPPEARRELLAEARAQGLITTTIKMLPKGSGKNWLVQVQVRYGNVDGELIWVSRCKHESYWNERDSWSIEKATKCALKGALARQPRAVSSR